MCLHKVGRSLGVRFDYNRITKVVCQLYKVTHCKGKQVIDVTQG